MTACETEAVQVAAGRVAGGAELRLAPMTDEEARILSRALAAMEPWSAYPFSPDSLARYLAEREPGAPRYTLRVGDETAGAVGIRRRWLRGPYLQMLAVLVPFQRMGVGRAVLGWLEGEARTAGENNLWVCTSDFNAVALAFYERNGFSRVAGLDGLVADDISEILLRKRLNPTAGS